MQIDDILTFLQFKSAISRQGTEYSAGKKVNKSIQLNEHIVVNHSPYL